MAASAGSRPNVLESFAAADPEFVESVKLKAEKRVE